VEIIQRILIDTNIYSLAFKGDEEVSETLREVSGIGLTAISVGELLSGFRGGRNEKRNRKQLTEFLDTPRVTLYPIDESTAEYYSAILDQLRKDGTPIPTNDIWIASVARQHGLPLFTRDKHFSKVDGLLLMD